MSPAGVSWDAVLFDLDGTLADTTSLIVHCYQHAMALHRDAVPPSQYFIEGMGKPLDVQFREFTEDEEEVESLIEAYVAHQRIVHDDFVAAFEGARAAVQRVLERGARTAIVTSKRREMALRTLASSGLDDLFEIVVTPEDSANHKPHPEPVLIALERIGGPRAEHTLFVGDSPFDIEAGQAAGVKTAGALWGPHGRARLEPMEPDYCVESLDALPSGPTSRSRRAGRAPGPFR